MRFLRIGGGLFDGTLRQFGHEVLPFGFPDGDAFRDPETARSLLAGAAESFRPDWILQVDDSTPLVHLGLERFPIPKAWYAVDSHLHAWHAHYAALFDRVFCAQANQVERLGAYLASQGAVTWLPPCFNGEPAFLPWAQRVHDVAFVGTLDPALNPARLALLEGLAGLGLAVHAVRGEYAPVYTRARVVINQAAADDLNFRVFEAMGCGALLLTDAISHSLSAIGEPGRDFLVYAPGDAADLARQARWALAHPAEAEAMARRGQERVKAGHLIRHRAGTLVRELMAPAFRSPSRVPGPVPGPDRAHLPAQLAATLEHVSRLELPADITRMFARRARSAAGDALMADPGSPWALLVLAQLELEAGRPGPALAFLEKAPGHAGIGYRRRYLQLMALLLAFAGRLEEAEQALGEGLREFPGDGGLARLREVIAAGPRVRPPAGISPGPLPA
jgi:hypothetical protein